MPRDDVFRATDHFHDRRLYRERTNPQRKNMTSNETTDDDAGVDLLSAIRSCALRLRIAATSCDSVPPTVTSFTEDQVPVEVWDMPSEALREACIAAGQLTVVCLLKRQGITATEDADDDRELLATVDTAARQLAIANQCSMETYPTITEFIGSIISGYSTYDIRHDQLREASFSAGVLVASAEVLDRSIAELLDNVSVSDKVYGP